MSAHPVSDASPALQGDEPILQLLTEAAPNGLILLSASAEHRILSANRHARKLFGAQADGFPDALAGLIAPQCWAEVSERMRLATAESADTREMTPPVEAIAMRRDGSTFACELVINPFHTSKRPLLAVAVTDVTSRSELATALSRKNEDLRQFTYLASHDLQEPLRMIVSYCQLLQRRYGDSFDDKGQLYLRMATESAERLRTLIDALLEFSRLDQRPIHAREIQLAPLAGKVMEDLRLQAQDAQARLVVEELPESVRGDETLLRQVLQNLVSNAIKFRRADRAACVRVRGERRAGEVEIVVEDNGIGIDTGQLDRVFTMFQRLHTREEYPGDGIGLAISKRIVEAHGGRLWHTPAPEGGSRFHFTIPQR
ncbi:MAG TPA: ATP-binding protein [Candidatus Thermoplasmatota archaeon]|nr:ATP-binding protein [Candidatus Thermoplasmatota archaeon]